MGIGRRPGEARRARWSLCASYPWCSTRPVRRAAGFVSLVRLASASFGGDRVPPNGAVLRRSAVRYSAATSSAGGCRQYLNPYHAVAAASMNRISHGMIPTSSALAIAAHVSGYWLKVS